LKFTGHERDPLGAGTTDDLDYMHARYYSPHLGRFMSPDPALESADPFWPQTWNRYSYVTSNPLKYIDPSGEILFFFGVRDDLEEIEEVANEALHGFDLVIADTGKATLVANNEQGPASPEQEAFKDTLAEAIDHPDKIGITATSNDSGVVFGRFISATMDIGDIAGVGPGRGVNSAAILAHEVAEQTVAQTRGLPFSAQGFAQAHPVGVAAQEAVSGFNRVSSTPNLDQQLTGSIVGVHRRGNQTVTVTFRFVRGNLVRVVRQP
jgi:RHS repeat-associated protein